MNRGIQQRGLSCLEPLIGRHEPARAQFTDLHQPVEGDFQDLRNRFGLLVPPYPRFANMDVHLKPQINQNRRNKIMNCLEREFAKYTVRRKPYYIDPMGRKDPDPSIRMMIDYRKATRPERVETKKETTKSAGHKTPVLLQQLMQSMPDAKQKREEEREKDAEVRGHGTAEGYQAASVPPSEQRGPPKGIAHHLYQPRKAKVKSEWTKNQELALALSRKNDIHLDYVKKLEKHKQHGDEVRSVRDLKDANKAEMYVERIRKKNEKVQKFLKSKVKY